MILLGMEFCEHEHLYKWHAQYVVARKTLLSTLWKLSHYS